MAFVCEDDAGVAAAEANMKKSGRRDEWHEHLLLFLFSGKGNCDALIPQFAREGHLCGLDVDCVYTHLLI
jgi:hypothetical protein